MPAKISYGFFISKLSSLLFPKANKIIIPLINSTVADFIATPEGTTKALTTSSKITTTITQDDIVELLSVISTNGVTGNNRFGFGSISGQWSIDFVYSRFQSGPIQLITLRVTYTDSRPDGSTNTRILFDAAGQTDNLLPQTGTYNNITDVPLLKSHTFVNNNQAFALSGTLDLNAVKALSIWSKIREVSQVEEELDLINVFEKSSSAAQTLDAMIRNITVDGVGSDEDEPNRLNIQLNAVKAEDLGPLAFESFVSWDEISGRPDVPEKVSELLNDSGFQTAAQVTGAVASHDADPAAHGSVLQRVSDLETGKVSRDDVINNLVDGGTEVPLSAEMGRELAVRVDAANGSGWFIPPYDFGTDAPAQQDLTDYAMQYIFGADAGSHAQTEIFNGTKVQNLNDHRVWQLANTTNTNPVIFSWEPALLLGEAQRNFLQYPLQPNELSNNSVTDAKIGNRTLSDSEASDTLPSTGTLTAILQAVRNCLKWLTRQFNTNTGHSHDGVDSRKISYNDLEDKPSGGGSLPYETQDFINFHKNYNSVTSLQNIPVSAQTVFAETTGNQTISVIAGTTSTSTIGLQFTDMNSGGWGDAGVPVSPGVDGYSFVSPAGVTSGQTVKTRILFTTTLPNQVVAIAMLASSHTSYGFGVVGLLDNNNLAYNGNYTRRVSGTSSAIAYINVPTPGSHYVDIGYGKSSNTVANNDCCYFCLLLYARDNEDRGYYRLLPGRTVQVFIHNKDTSERTITLPNSSENPSYILMSDQTLPIKANGYAEICVTALQDGKYSIRSGGQPE